MKTRGFTLIELLAVIIVLSLIAGIAVTSISKTISNSKQKLKAIQIEEIKKAASKYYMTSDVEIEEGDSTCINVSYLLEEGYFEDDNIEDPTTGENISGSVTISLSGLEVFYEYNKDTCKGGNKESSTYLVDNCSKNPEEYTITPRTEYRTRPKDKIYYWYKDISYNNQTSLCSGNCVGNNTYNFTRRTIATSYSSALSGWTKCNGTTEYCVHGTNPVVSSTTYGSWGPFNPSTTSSSSDTMECLSAWCYNLYNYYRYFQTPGSNFTYPYWTSSYRYKENLFTCKSLTAGGTSGVNGQAMYYVSSSSHPIDSYSQKYCTSSTSCSDNSWNFKPTVLNWYFDSVKLYLVSDSSACGLTFSCYKCRSRSKTTNYMYYYYKDTNYSYQSTPCSSNCIGATKYNYKKRVTTTTTNNSTPPSGYVQCTATTEYCVHATNPVIVTGTGNWSSWGTKAKVENNEYDVETRTACKAIKK